MDVGEPAAAPDRDARRNGTARRTRLTIAGAVVVAAVLAAPVLAVATGIIDFGSSEPAPPDYKAVFKQFNELDQVSVPVGVQAGETRVVLRPTIRGREHMLLVAPRRNGGFCFMLIQLGQGGGATCVDAGDPIASLRSGGSLFGSVAARGATSVELLYRNRASLRAELVWVSEPIDAALFARAVPACPHVREVVARGSDGRELARERIPWSRC